MTSSTPAPAAIEQPTGTVSLWSKPMPKPSPACTVAGLRDYFRRRPDDVYVSVNPLIYYDTES